MAYKPISQSTKSGGYVPIGQSKKPVSKVVVDPQIVANLPGPDFGTSQSTQSVMTERPTGGKLLLPAVGKTVAQETLKDLAATAKTASTLDPNATITPTGLNKVLYGSEPFSLRSQSEGTLTMFGASEETERKYAPIAIAGLALSDILPGSAGARRFFKAGKTVDNTADAVNLLRRSGVSDDVIFGLKLDQKLVRATTDDAVEAVFKEASNVAKASGAVKPGSPTKGISPVSTKSSTPVTKYTPISKATPPQVTTKPTATVDIDSIKDTIIKRLEDITPTQTKTGRMTRDIVGSDEINKSIDDYLTSLKKAKEPEITDLNRGLELLRVSGREYDDIATDIVTATKEIPETYTQRAGAQDIKPKGIIASAVDNLKNPALRQGGYVGEVPQGIPGRPPKGTQSLPSTKSIPEDGIPQADLPTLPKLPENIRAGLQKQSADKTISDAVINRYREAQTRTPKGDTELAAAAKKPGNTEGFMKLASQIATPISSRLMRINPELKRTLRKFEFSVAKKTTDNANEILPLLNATKKMSKEDQVIFDLARKNGDSEVIDALATKYDIHDELNRTRDVLNELYERAKAVGMDIEYRGDYFPRMITNPEKFMAYLRGRDDWGIINRLIEAAAEKKGKKVFDLTEEEKSSIVNNFIRGYGDKTVLAAPGFSKSRTIEVIDDALNEFYESSDSALSAYIVRMNDEIEGRRFFGKELKAADEIGDADIQDSIGSYVLKLVADGKIKPTQEKEVSDILKARFHRGKMNGALDLYRNAEYISTMGSPISAITQIGDLAFSAYENGLYHTSRGIGKSLFSKNKISKEMLGVENITQEFTKNTFSGKALDDIFKATGLNKMDRLGKETLVNGAFSKMQAQARRNDDVLMRELEFMFGPEEAKLAKQDLLDGKYTDRTLELAFDKLLDYQPVAKSEMPQKYLEMPNGRIFYMLKSFTLKQYDVFRTRAIDDIVSGEPKRVAKGLKNLVKLSAMFVAANATADEIKDLILGRETPPSDKVVDNAWRLVGATKYDVYKARTDGVARTIQGKLLFPTSIIDRAGKDIYNQAVDKEYEKGPLKGESYKLESTQTIPVAGKLYYWWFGRGAQKEEYKEGGTATGNLPQLPKLETANSTTELPKLPKLPSLGSAQ